MPTVDSALLLRARRLAKRSRAETACQLCKASKLRCSDYRPCARCKKVGAELCTDMRSSTPRTPQAIKGAQSSDLSLPLTSKLADCSSRASSDHVSALQLQTANCPPASDPSQPPAKPDDSSRWRLARLPPLIPPIPPLTPTLLPPPYTPLEPSLAEVPDQASSTVTNKQCKKPAADQRDNRLVGAGMRQSRPASEAWHPQAPPPSHHWPAHSAARHHGTFFLSSCAPHTSCKFDPATSSSAGEASASADVDIFRPAGRIGAGGSISIARRWPTGGSPAGGGGSGGGAEWAWEAVSGPGPEDPFRADWKHWG
jgi:hypothetical protein